MKRFIVNQNNIINNNVVIEGSEFNHLKNVLRLKENDEIILLCNDEFEYFAKINRITKNQADCEIIKKQLNKCNPKKHLCVFQAIVKNENMNMIIQKLSEIGVSEIVPFESEFITSKNSENKRNKLQEIANQSIKQCGRSIALNVKEVVSFNKMCELLLNFDIVIFANETEKNTKLSDINSISKSKNVAIIIGSEGGFSEIEINKIKSVNNVVSVSLGNRILRAETASIVLSAIINYSLGEFI